MRCNKGWHRRAADDESAHVSLYGKVQAMLASDIIFLYQSKFSALYGNRLVKIQKWFYLSRILQIIECAI